MKLPKIDLKEMEDLKRRNFEERLRFIEIYVEWLKKKHKMKIEKVKNHLYPFLEILNDRTFSQ